MVGVFLACQGVASTYLLASSFSGFQNQRDRKNASSGGSFGSLLILVEDNTLDFSVSDVSGRAGEKIPLNISSQPSGTPEDIFMISGLPLACKLSKGMFVDDFWLVRRKDLASLMVTTPNSFSGALQVKVTRARTQSAPPATLNLSVKVEGPRSVYVRSSEEAMLFEKANKMLKEGDVTAARAIFEYLADKGDAGAAIAMGETYDPIILSRMFIKGLRPDKTKAESWYQKARDLGGLQAEARLQALSQN